MAAIELETRVAVLEQEVADFKSKIERSPLSEAPWWDRIAGTFANEPAHVEAMKLGQKYRRCLRPRNSGERKG